MLSNIIVIIGVQTKNSNAIMTIQEIVVIVWWDKLFLLIGRWAWLL